MGRSYQSVIKVMSGKPVLLIALKVTDALIVQVTVSGKDSMI